MTNYAKLNQYISKNALNISPFLIDKDVRALGIVWNTEYDHFTFAINLKERPNEHFYSDTFRSSGSRPFLHSRKYGFINLAFGRGLGLFSTCWHICAVPTASLWIITNFKVENKPMAQLWRRWVNHVVNTHCSKSLKDHILLTASIRKPEFCY